jgi:hypothetical protein
MRTVPIRPLVLALISGTPLSACGSRALTRDTATGLLATTYAERIAQSCTLHQRLQGKTEFATFRGKQVCNARLEVTGVHKVSDTEAHADVALILSPNATTAELPPAFSSLEQRLLSLPVMFCDGFNCPPGFWDATDQQAFTSRDECRDAPRISCTGAWDQIQRLKSEVNDMLKKGAVTKATFGVAFALYDDGWRVKDPTSWPNQN